MKSEAQNTHCSLIIYRTDPRVWIDLLKHNLEPSANLVEIGLDKVAYEAPCIDNDEKFLARDFILLVRTKLARTAVDCYCGVGNSQSQKVPTLSGLFFDFAMRKTQYLGALIPCK
jgi:hypothetical protein